MVTRKRSSMAPAQTALSSNPGLHVLTLGRPSCGLGLTSLQRLFQITAAQYQILQSLFFTINGVTYEFPPSAQIWPPTLNTAIGGRPDMIYLAVSNMPTPGGCIAGQVFLERFYSAWDNTNRRVGFANTPWTLS
ncbi:Aspartic peptidase A1 [Mycena indigotica]|uniref:Aspartic peptidase A1 n=1 Tax=Mycena indigotica TaxID=2126181 RepID=A0A8H6S055_9AGAR|nr:Aspartic peptidase A1 [Mycena indigotica]KAF7289800.1 Aspartic peptidase A1 [Mycena indigotica]